MIFEKVLRRLAERVPGIERVESKVTEEGRVLPKFQDGAFEDPFLARYVSDGTIKMLAYLLLLLDPKPHPLLCVEEPENQLYPALLSELAEDWLAIAQAFSRPQLAHQAQKAIYRNPDRLAHPVTELRKFIPDYQKREGARLLGPLLEPGRNQCVSFRKFCAGLQKLVADAP